MVALGALAFCYDVFGVFETESVERFVVEFNSVTNGEWVIIGLVFIGLFLFCLWSHKNKNSWKVKFIEKSVLSFFYTIFFMYALFIFMLLGSLHGIYGYESTMATDLNVSMGIMGNAFYMFYEVGDSYPTKGLIIFFIAMGSAISYCILDVIDFYKEHLNETKENPKPKPSKQSLLPKHL